MSRISRPELRPHQIGGLNWLAWLGDRADGSFGDAERLVINGGICACPATTPSSLGRGALAVSIESPRCLAGTGACGQSGAIQFCPAYPVGGVWRCRGVAGSIASGPKERSKMPKGRSSMAGGVPAMRQCCCPWGEVRFGATESGGCLSGAADSIRGAVLPVGGTCRCKGQRG